MATSGYKDATVTSHDTLRLSWTRTDYSIPNNTSTVKWELLLITDSVGRISSSNARAWAVTVNGTAYSGSSVANVGNSSTLTLASGSTTIGHNSDGSKTFSYSFSYNFSGITFSGTALGTVSGSSTGTLDTIPRVSSISVPAFTMGTAGTISVSRADSSFSDTLTWTFGSASGTIATKTTNTSVSWTPDAATLAAEIPNATSGTGTITCITYSGSTEIGRSSATFTANVPSSAVPSISKVATSEATSGLASQFGVYVQSKSTLKVAITAAGIYGSTIKSYSVSFNGKTYSGNNCTTSAPTKSGSLTLTATVTDSRGRKASTDITVSVTAYSNPAITALSAHRCDANGNTQDDGDYVSIAYAYSIAAVGNKNTKSAVIQYKRSTASDWTNLLSNTAYSANTTVVPTTALSADYQWDIRLTVTDYFGSSEMAVTLPSAEVLMDLLASGDGASFGKTAEEADLLDVAWGMRIGGPLEIKGLPVADYIVDIGTSGIWTYRKYASGIAECWGGAYYTMTQDGTVGGVVYSTQISVELPFAMTNCRVTAGCGYVCYACNFGVSGSTLNFRLARPNAVAPGDVYVSLAICGKLS